MARSSAALAITPHTIGTDYDLRQLIRRHLDTEREVNPAKVAESLFYAMTPAEREDALLKLLPDAVRSVMATERRGLFTAEVIPTSTPTAAGVPGRSRMRNWAGWQRALRVQVHVGTGAYRRLGECTAADLQFAVDERRRIAAANLGQAALFDRLHALVVEQGVAKVADLGDDTLAEVLDPAVLATK